MMPGEKIQLVCPKCSRKLSMTPQVLAKRRACTCCGESIPLTPEIETILQQALSPATATPSVTQKAVLIECPVCARESRYKPAMVGQRVACSFCACPYFVPESDGMPLPALNDQLVPRIEPGFLLKIPCPACGESACKTSNSLGTAAACSSCQAPVACTAMPLETFVPMPSTTDRTGMASFVVMVLQARWQRGDLGLGEAAKLAHAVIQLENWAGQKQLGFTPLAPDLTAEIVQYAVLCAPGGSRGRFEGAIVLTVPWKAASGDSGSISGGALVGTALGIGLLAATGHGFIMLGGRRRDDGTGPVRLYHMRFEFTPSTSGGSDMGLSIKIPDGGIAAAGNEMTQAVARLIKSGFLSAARKYLAFKAIFGIASTGDMYSGAAPLAIQRRLEVYGEPLTSVAPELAAALKAERVIDLSKL